MIEQELKAIWHKSSQIERIELDLTTLLIELKNKMDTTDRRIRRRDRREIIACYIGMLPFAFMAWEIPYPISKLACLLTIGWFAYVIYRLKKAGRNKEPDLSLPFKEQLESRKNYLKGQAQLLNSVLYWYVLPPFLINVLFFAGIGEPSDYNWTSFLAEWLPDGLRDKIVSLSFVAVFYAYIVWTNRKAARTYYPPLIRDIERIQEESAQDD